MKTADLITHTHPPATAEAVEIAAAVAREAGWRLVADADVIEKQGVPEGVEPAGDADRPDLCLVLGGDGSILRALRRYARTGVPVFGVNFGTVGFLAAIDREAAEEGIGRALAGQIETVELPGLEVSLGDQRGLGFNDITLARRPQDRVAELTYRIAGEEVGHVRCDGLVAATPAGSTGYNLANGGPVLAWGVEGYVVSFIAPHTLTARALVVAPDDTLAVTNRSREEDIEMTTDGRSVCVLPHGETITIRFAPRCAQLAQLPGASFYHRLRDKFGRLAY